MPSVARSRAARATTTWQGKQWGGRSTDGQQTAGQELGAVPVIVIGAHSEPVSASGAGHALVGTRHFWRSDLTTHHRPDLSVFIKTSSTRTLQPESGNGEGLKNLHLADGVTFLMRDGNEYDGLMPVWNWRNLPGTTTEQGTYALTPPSDWGVAGTSTHVGAAATGTDAAVAYVHQRLGVNARKSWFLFDDRLIALGSGFASPPRGCTTRWKRRSRSLTGRAPSVTCSGFCRSKSRPVFVSGRRIFLYQARRMAEYLRTDPGMPIS